MAEEQVASWLCKQGHCIVVRNWKGYRCEIDIISRKGGTLFFVEVKYRSTYHQGGGGAAITAKKLAQMEYAADCYIAFIRAPAIQRQLAVASVNGMGYIEYLALAEGI